MNILSLFDGISCGQVALKRAGINIDNYFASEVESSAIQITKHNFPQTIHVGDVRNISSQDFPKIDLMFGGSPCQSFSFSGKRNGMSTKCDIEIYDLEKYLELKEQNFEFEGQSYLFWEYVRLLKEVKPKYFLLENVIMDKKWETIITNTLKVEPIFINSKDFSAQSRPRLYWTNIPMLKYEKSKDMVIEDILDENVLYNTYNVEHRDYIKPKRIGDNLVCKISNFQTGRVYGMSGKSNTLMCDSRTYVLDERLSYDKLVKDESAQTVFVSDCINGVIRKLTPLEYERLQTLPDNYTNVEGVSNFMRYHAIGNGWTVDVIAHILKGLVETNVSNINDYDEELV